MKVKLVVAFDTPPIFAYDDFGRKTYMDTFVQRMGEYLVNTGAQNINVEGCDLDPDIIDKLVRRKP